MAWMLFRTLMVEYINKWEFLILPQPLLVFGRRAFRNITLFSKDTIYDTFDILLVEETVVAGAECEMILLGVTAPRSQAHPRIFISTWDQGGWIGIFSSADTVDSISSVYGFLAATGTLKIHVMNKQSMKLTRQRLVQQK